MLQYSHQPRFITRITFAVVLNINKDMMKVVWPVRTSLLERHGFRAEYRNYE
jgi:hypothetical protein